MRAGGIIWIVAKEYGELGEGFLATICHAKGYAQVLAGRNEGRIELESALITGNSSTRRF